MLGGLAEFEREFDPRPHRRRPRPRRGKRRQDGRKPKMTEHQKRETIRRRAKGEESLAEIGRSYNVPAWTISRVSP